MKHILLLIALIFSVAATSQNYKNHWQKVIAFEEEGLTKPANEEVNKIYVLAKKDRNEPQLLKTFFFRAKYMQLLEEDAQIKIVEGLVKERKNASPGTKAIIESLYAGMLEKIYSRNSYQIDRRTKVEGTTPEDFLIWDTKNFESEIEAAYKHSLMERELLYNIPLAAYKEIIDFGPMPVKMERSLYDFLAEQYLNSKSVIQEYTDKTFSDVQARQLFGDSSQFMALALSDSIGKHLANRIALCRELEEFYIKKNDAYSLQRSVLRRLQIADSNIYVNEKRTIYLSTLEKLSVAWNNSPFAYRAKFLLAGLYTSLADKKTSPDYLHKAVALCDDIIANAERNDASPEAANLKNGIMATGLQITAENTVIPGRPGLARIAFRNTDAMTVKIYKVSYSQSQSFEKLRDEGYFKNAQVYVEKAYPLPVKKDFFEYTTEVVLPPLEMGYYVIAAFTNDGAGIFDGAYASAIVNATDVLLTKQESNTTITYQASDRKTGKPMKNVKAEIDGKTFKTDKRGMVSIPMTTTTGKSKKVLFIHQGDTLDTTYRDRYYSSNKDEHVTATAQIYLDRAIYRPGQQVFFKGIVVQDKSGTLSTVDNIHVSVTVSDANDKDIYTFRLPTNEFGSFTGDFMLPATGKTGGFSITVSEDEAYEKGKHPFWDDDNLDFDGGYAYFQVEEYKRPTFDVKFDAVTQDIRLNENVFVTGNAKAFSGAPVQNGKVIYRVIRNANMTRYTYYGNGGNKVIAAGAVATGSDGQFKITFPATPDPAYDPKGLPLFTYTVYADIIDMSGETHGSSKYVMAGYHSLTLEMKTPGFIDPGTKYTIPIGSKNLNGEFRPAKGEIKIYKVKEDNRVYKKRTWGFPELQTITKEEFEKNFPVLPYSIINKDTVIHERLLRTIAVSTLNTKEITLDNFSGWEPGKYEAVFTAKDSLGQEVKTTGQFILKSKNGDAAINSEFLFEIVNKDFKKDGFIEIEMRSGLPLLYINARAANMGKSIYDEIVTMKNGRKTIKVPVTKKMQKQVALAFDFVWENDFYNRDGIAELTTDLEKLDIESEAITSKLQPGSPQTWSFTIKNKDKLPVEVLASMYDASLDQFETDFWNHPNQTRDHDYNRIPYKQAATYDYRMYLYYNSEVKIKAVKHKNDSFYTYGFDINKAGNIYPVYAPKGQVAGTGSLLIRGTVTDSAGMPVPGAAVTIQGTHEGSQTDIDGAYLIYANKGDIIVFTYLGMLTKVVAIEDCESCIIDVMLEDDGTMLEDVVVEAYRSTTRALSNVATTTITSKTIEGRPNASFIETLQGQVPGLNISSASGQPGANSTVILRGTGSINGNVEPLFVIDGVPLSVDEFRELNPNDIASLSILKDAGATSIYGNRGANGVIVINTKKAEEDMKALQQVQARKNFKETAFFYPQLRTDNDGKIAFTFNMPEALTEWKLRILAHNKNVATGYLENTFRSQKDLMVVPNMPRFFREKDTVVIFAKVVNLTAEPKTGTALLQLFDAVTMQPVDAQMLNTNNMKPFTIPANGTSTVSWTIAIPEGLQGVQYKVLAKAGDFTDGEENILPVLPNNMLVTESLPLWVKSGSTKEYTFENLINNSSPTLRHQGISLEYTSNPAWLALKSLPYLMEYEHQCAEQVFSRYYANAIAAHIVEGNPAIAAVFAEWRKAGKPVSKFEQNEELKSVIMAETPWLLDAESDEEQKNRLALLFDLDKMKTGLKASFEQLLQKQSGSGAFPWFDGGQDNEYITRHILAGFGHLQKLGIESENESKTENMLKKAIAFTDAKFMEQYQKTIIAHGKKTSFIKRQPYSDLHYLYMRSFYLTSNPLSEPLKEAIKPYLNDIRQDWQDYSLYEKGIAALVLHRFGDTATAKKIVESLRQTSANNEEWGMYWIANKAGWDWHRAPIETQALLIEAFTEIDNDTKSADAMKVWLIKQKQAKNWPTTKSTSEVVYALLMQGSNWLSVKENTVLKLGDTLLLEQKIAESGKEAETGYMKLQWKPGEVTKEMATLKIENKSDVPGYGGFYWQYFEDLDKIKPAQKGIMNVSKELYLKTTATDGAKLQRITAANPLKIADLVTVRLVVTVKEDVEYIHLKDLRAAAFEPVDVLSGYKWQDGLGYYQSTRDTATHFFFDTIKRGTYVLEYDVRVNNAGEYSNGITTIQSMYAPEFSGHTRGIRVKAVEK